MNKIEVIYRSDGEEAFVGNLQELLHNFFDSGFTNEWCQIARKEVEDCGFFTGTHEMGRFVIVKTEV